MQTNRLFLIICFIGLVCALDCNTQTYEDLTLDTKTEPEHEAPKIHKSLYPLNLSDEVGLVVAALSLVLAAGGGIGGGGILVPVYIIVLGFAPKMAVPLSNITVFGGAVANTLLNAPKRHPLTDRPLVDWDLILIMEPLTIGGALVGSFVNKVVPEWVLAASLIALLSFTAHRTIEKGMSQYKNETDKKKKESELVKIHREINQDSAHESLLDDCEDTVRDVDPRLKELLDEESQAPHFKMGGLILLFLTVLTVNLLKGGGGFASPVGIECGSTMFWASTGFVLVLCAAVSLYVREYLLSKFKLKKAIGYQFIEGDVEWNPKSTIKYPFLCFFAGFFAGMFGIGGGIIKGPLMIEMGVHPLVASATSSCMILYTTFTATTSYAVFGMLQYDYGFFMLVMGFISTIAGQLLLTSLIKKSGRNSYVTLIIGVVVALSALLMGLESILELINPSGRHSGSICEGGIH